MSDKELDEILNEIKMRSSESAVDKPSDKKDIEPAQIKAAPAEPEKTELPAADENPFRFESLPKQETRNQKEIHSIIREDIKELKEKTSLRTIKRMSSIMQKRTLQTMF